MCCPWRSRKLASRNRLRTGPRHRNSLVPSPTHHAGSCGCRRSSHRGSRGRGSHWRLLHGRGQGGGCRHRGRCRGRGRGRGRGRALLLLVRVHDHPLAPPALGLLAALLLGGVGGAGSTTQVVVLVIGGSVCAPNAVPRAGCLVLHCVWVGGGSWDGRSRGGWLGFPGSPEEAGRGRGFCRGLCCGL